MWKIFFCLFFCPCSAVEVLCGGLVSHPKGREPSARDSVRTSVDRHREEVIDDLTIAGKHSQEARDDPVSCRRVILDVCDSPASRTIAFELTHLARTCAKAVARGGGWWRISCERHCFTSCSPAASTTQCHTAPASTRVFEHYAASVRHAVEPARPQRNLFCVTNLYLAKVNRR